MYFKTSSTKSKGFSFVELLVTAAIISLVFGGLFASVQGMIELIGSSKAKAGATALAVEEIEYIRSLPYASVGTVSGVPSGLIPQTSTTTLNGIEYSKRVLIEYVDDEADGFGGADTNGILADYKRAKVEFTWSRKGVAKSVALVTSIMPVGIESTAGGGTIRVNVFDASALPISNAAVHFFNDTTTSTIDTTRYTNAEGIAYLAGAPAAANYQISATKAGYTTDGTTMATTSNPNPTTQPIAVAESSVSTMNFQIDKISALTIETVGEPTLGSFSDTFTDDSLVLAYASTTRIAGEVVLEGGVGTYVASGTVMSATTSPGTLDSWQTVDFTKTTSASTSVRVSVYYENAGVLALVPDVDLPGNSFGFSGGPVALDLLNPSTYHTLALQATLSTIDSLESPSLEDWTISYIEAQADIGLVDFTLRGNKIVGTDASALPIYKTSYNTNTDSNGLFSLTSVEWDTYTLNITDTAYQAVEICKPSPFVVQPDSSQTVKVVLHSYTSPWLRVAVSDSSGNSVAGASVELDAATGPYNVSQLTSTCGQTSFYGGGLVSANDYQVTVSASGFTTSVITDVVVSSTSTLTVILN